MDYRTADALSQAHIQDAMPIRGELKDDGYYHLRGANGEHRSIAAGSAQTAWGNAAWPKRGKWAVLWMYANVVEQSVR